MDYKETQDRIDNNSVTDLEMDRGAMMKFLRNELTRDQLEMFKDLCEKLIDSKLLKLETAFWLILLWKEIHTRDHKILAKDPSKDQGKEF